MVRHTEMLDIERVGFRVLRWMSSLMSCSS
jgi:hypothetical protein